MCQSYVLLYDVWLSSVWHFSPQYQPNASISSYQKVILHIQRCEMELRVEKIEQLCLLLSSKPENTELQPVLSSCVLYRGVQPFTAVVGMASFCYWGPFFSHPFRVEDVIACRLVHFKTSTHDLLFFSQLLFLKAFTLIWPFSRVWFMSIQFALDLPLLAC